MLKGYITKAISGFYYVKTENEILECKAKGVFRNKKITPLVGDNVFVEKTDESYTVCEILERKNEFVRPPISNIDIFFIVVSTLQPNPNALVIDRLTAIAYDKDVEPIILTTKSDLKQDDEVMAIYQNTGIKVINAYNNDNTVNSEIIELMKNKLVAFCGNSGVGKSTLINKIFPQLNRETASISKKLGRGKHTTRAVEIFEIDDFKIADTPGFASIDTDNMCYIHKDNIQFLFPEIKKRIGECKFTGCTHTKEKGCSVIQALQDNEINESRYNSYLTMYEKSKQIKDWQR